ncbi:pheromone-processing carboxypeptidase KEX1 [Drosophila guanche]|uniref:Blast:Larval cuticle protein A3A n=1 Tax=Drosophila guanche TaxID=7266 RepID=A0A3B0JXZ8_DROGU|nr:pheromone-processing carboxypeptidase KEX1 [Drosophila guanche]SPP85302.1 blast:Larval cuticle protein A3A [Drosophila guanche]
MKRRRVIELVAVGTRFGGFRVASWKMARACHTRLLGLIVGLGMIGVCSAVGYSYTRFEGPVAGPEHLVTVHNGRTDYVARPEYSFAYGVEDGKTRVLQNRKETRNGDEVRGVYSVVDPDGTLRVVKYTADDANGFQAEVITNGVKTLHGHGGDDGGAPGAPGNGGASVDEQVRHETPAETEAEDEEGDQVDQGKAYYKVHEDYDESDDDDDGEEKHKEGDEDHEEGGGDHQEYEGSSEEGYDEADAHSQAEQQESSEEY